MVLTEAVAASPWFSPAAWTFLRGLARNNRREWFEERRLVYENELRRPALALIESINHHLAEFAPEHVRPAQKSLMRIYRDTRFSSDKTPYKTHVAAWWGSPALEKTSGGGFYLQAGPRGVLVAAGVYRPQPPQLLAIRQHLLEHHEEFRVLLAARKLKSSFKLDHGTPLTRTPKGFPPGHPADDLLRSRQWALHRELPAGLALEPDFAARVAGCFRLAAPVVSFLNRPLLKPRGRRVLFPLA